MARKVILTAALPYANGPLHIGHLTEYLQADYWCRFQKMRGVECLYFCAEDTHGTPIMVRSKELGVLPEKLIEQSYNERLKDFGDFQVQFDHYSSTNSPANQKLCGEFYEKIKSHLERKTISQLYCAKDKMFLPDRFVKGTCPKCNSADQYGDSCDSCGSTYSPADLKNPGCSICGTAPTLKATEHLFFKVNDFKEFLRGFLNSSVSPEVRNKMLEWFDEDLRPWDISRDEPYFGFKIPGEKGKYFYVWVDAPMGYISTLQEWASKNGRTLSNTWNDPEVEIYHLIGKDITYFHTLFWPALLKAAGFRLPTQIWVHGRLMINGAKMSKSKGSSISVRSYLNHLDPQYLRYYFASKLNSSSDDYDLNFEDFANRVNSDLVGKLANLGSRAAQMLKKKLDGKLSTMDSQGRSLWINLQERSKSVAELYEQREFSKVITEIRDLTDLSNRYFDEKSPWKTLESHPRETKEVLTATLNLFRTLTILVTPILPEFSKKVSELFGEESYLWSDLSKTLESSEIQDYQHLVTRVESEKVQALLEECKAQNAVKEEVRNSIKTKGLEKTPEEHLVDIDSFNKIDLKVGRIIKAESVEGADKLLRLQVDLGESKPRQIFAGLKSAYSPEILEGRLTVVVANLKPRQMKFGLSEGMILAAGPGGKDLFILNPDEGAQVGHKVK